MNALYSSDEQPITVPVPPWLMERVCQQLDANGIPYQATGNTITTLPVAQPILDMVLAPQQPKRKVNAMPMDLRILGFVACIVMVAGVFVSSGEVMPLAAGAGINPFGAHGVAMVVVGAVVTFFLWGRLPNDGRRMLFVLGMMGLFAAGALWFVGQGLGVL